MATSIRDGTQELARSHEIEVDAATSFADFDAAVSGIDSEPAAEIPEWNRYAPMLLSVPSAWHPASHLTEEEHFHLRE